MFINISHLRFALCIQKISVDSQSPSYSEYTYKPFCQVSPLVDCLR